MPHMHYKRSVGTQAPEMKRHGALLKEPKLWEHDNDVCNDGIAELASKNGEN